MWLISPVGFFSVVRKTTDILGGTLTVRSRVRGDLEQLKVRCLPELGVITESATNDYRFRAVASQAAVAQAMSHLVLDLDYPNFKDAVAQRQGRARADLYHEVWSVLCDLERTPQGQVHPRRDDEGLPVVIRSPSTPSSQRAWRQAAQIAAVTPGGKLPDSLHRMRFESWVDAPVSASDWEVLAGAALLEEPSFKPPKGLQAAAGVVIREPDGRIWVVCPTNQYGDHEVTFPKGRLEGKSLQATALCEAYEESGLRVRLIRHLVDVRRTQTFTRYYLAERVGGSPADMGWESQCVMLVPADALGSLDLAPADKQVVRALEDSVQP
jgi:8-oxo-dGTP pyrophosphatase MutT (NUDIX family)